jgi:hypothetical protein
MFCFVLLCCCCVYVVAGCVYFELMFGLHTVSRSFSGKKENADGKKKRSRLSLSFRRRQQTTNPKQNDSGKLLNVRDATAGQVSDNVEINHIKQILGLQHGRQYTDAVRFVFFVFVLPFFFARSLFVSFRLAGFSRRSLLLLPLLSVALRACRRSCRCSPRMSHRHRPPHTRTTTYKPNTSTPPKQQKTKTRQTTNNKKKQRALRYGSLMIMTDQDHDGSHIKGLIMNFLHTFYPTLLRVPGFLVEFITPIVKARPRGGGGRGAAAASRAKVFYTMPEYEV